MIAGVAAIDAVVAIGVDKLAEVLVGVDECCDVLGGVLIVHVVISQSMTEQQGTMQLVGAGNGADIIITICIFIGRTHEALGVDGIVEAPTGGRRNGDAAAEHGPSFAHSHQRVPAAVAPAPDGDVLFVDVALLTQPEGGLHLVFGL